MLDRKLKYIKNDYKYHKLKHIFYSTYADKYIKLYTMGQKYLRVFGISCLIVHFGVLLIYLIK